jgi:hypothetical protein
VFVLLGSGWLLLCSGAFSLESVLGLLLGNDNKLVVFSLWSCCWAAAQQWDGLFFGVRSEDPLLGKCGVFFSVHSDAI